MDLQIDKGNGWERREVAKRNLSIGGTEADDLVFSGLPAALVTVRFAAGHWLVKTTEPLVIGGSLCPARILRLWLPSEELELPGGTRLRVPQVAPSRERGTATLLAGLMRHDAVSHVAAPTFTCLTGLDMGHRFVAPGQHTTIGRGEDADVQIRERAVSRRHARVNRTSTGWQLTDCGSPNGIFVNGKRITEPYVLRDGDVLELGHSLLKVHLPPAPRAPTPVMNPKSAPPPPPKEALAEAVDCEAEPNESTIRQPAVTPNWMVLGLGALLAFVGAVMTWHLTF